MKYNWLITFRSVTFAQKGERVLKNGGISCQLQRTPKLLSERGCGYCLRMQMKDAMTATELLQEKGIAYGKIYALTEGGIPQERVL